MIKMGRNAWNNLSPELVCPKCKGPANRSGAPYWFAKNIAPYALLVTGFCFEVLRGGHIPGIEQKWYYPIFPIGTVLFLVLAIFEWHIFQEVPSFFYRCEKCEHTFRVRIRPPFLKRPFYLGILIFSVLFLGAMAVFYFACAGRVPSCM